MKNKINLKRVERNDKIKVLGNQLENDLRNIDVVISENKVIVNTRKIEINERKHARITRKRFNTEKT